MSSQPQICLRHAILFCTFTLKVYIAYVTWLFYFPQEIGLFCGVDAVLQISLHDSRNFLFCYLKISKANSLSDAIYIFPRLFPSEEEEGNRNDEETKVHATANLQAN